MQSSGSIKKITSIVEVYYKWKNSPRFEKWKRKFDSTKPLKISTDMLLSDEISESELEWSYDNSPTTQKRQIDFVYPYSFPKRRCLGSTSMHFDLEDPFLTVQSKFEISFSLDDELQQTFEEKQTKFQSGKVSSLPFSKGSHEKKIVHAMRELTVDEYDFSPENIGSWFNT